MTDEKITALTEITSVATDDIIPLTHDPSGTPVTKKATVQNILKTLSSLTADSSPDSAADYMLEYDASAGTVKKVLIDTVLSLVSTSTDGWTSDANTWSYSSADSPTFVISINADMTAILQAGMRIKLTQTTAKYFIVTAVGSYSGGATLVTVYGGTDYTLANAAISSPYYSMNKAPFGFPLSPIKWTVVVTDGTGRTQSSPTQNTWYNLGTTNEQISVPIGIWDLYYEVAVYCVGTTTNINAFVTLSSANNSESDAEMTGYSATGAGSAALTTAACVFRRKTYVVASKTTYYLNAKTGIASMTTLGFDNASSKMVIRAVCAYL